MAYSSDERDAAAADLVQGTLSFPRDRLGTRDVAEPFEEVKELTYSAFLYDPDAIFYAVYLAKNYLLQHLNAELSTCRELLDAIDDLRMPEKPVEDISSIADARAALSIMESSLARAGVVGAQEYGRYRAAIRRAKRAFGDPIKLTYTYRGASSAVRDIVRPAAEAKEAVAAQFSTLRTQHATLLERAEQLSSAFPEYLSSNLTTAIGVRQVRRAADILSARQEGLEALSPAQRTASARETLLEVLANTGVIAALADPVLSGQPKLLQPISAAPTYRLSATGTGTAPSIEGIYSAPWPLEEGGTYLLEGTINGNPVSVDLFPAGPSTVPGIQPASLRSANRGPFALHSDLATPWPLQSESRPGGFVINATNGTRFYVLVDGIIHSCALTTGTRTAAQVASDISTAAALWTPANPISASAVGDRVQIAYTNGSNTPAYNDRHMEVLQGNDYASQLWPWQVDVPGGPVAGVRSDGWSGNNELRLQPNAQDTASIVSLPEGTWPDYLVNADVVALAIATSEFVASASGPTDFVTLESTVLGEGSILTIRSAGADTPSQRGAETLGFAVGFEVREHDVDGRAIANVLNNDAAFAAEATAHLTYESVFESRGATAINDFTLSVPVDEDPLAGWPSLGEIKLSVTSGENRGVYVLQDASYAPGVLTIEVDLLERTFREHGTAKTYHIVVYTSLLQIVSNDDSTLGSIQLSDPVGSARPIFGLPLTLERSTTGTVLVEWSDPVLGWRAFDLRRRKLKLGDRVLDGQRADVTTITGVGTLESGLIGVDPEVPADLFIANAGFSVESAAYLAYSIFQEALELWLAGAGTYPASLDQLDRLLNPLIRVKPGPDRVNVAYDYVSALVTWLEYLQTAMTTFVVTPVGVVDRVLQTLLERGYDRMRELLLLGRVSEFFSTTLRSASYSQSFAGAATEVAVEDVNEGSLARGRHTADYMRYAGDWREDRDPLDEYPDLEDELPDDPLEEYFPGIDEDVG